jgi:hypothetical protein
VPAPVERIEIPRTGTIVQVDEKAMPYFKPGKEMLERLNLIAKDAKSSDSLHVT